MFINPFSYPSDYSLRNSSPGNEGEKLENRVLLKGPTKVPM